MTNAIFQSKKVEAMLLFKNYPTTRKVKRKRIFLIVKWLIALKEIKINIPYPYKILNLKP